MGVRAGGVAPHLAQKKRRTRAKKGEEVLAADISYEELVAPGGLERAGGCRLGHLCVCLR